MISLTIDTSVFGIPDNSDDKLSGIINFLGNMIKLQELESNPLVTVSLMDSIPLNLDKINCKVDKIEHIIKDSFFDLVQELKYDPEELVKYYHSLCDKLQSPVNKKEKNKDRQKFKGTGIHYNLPTTIEEETKDVKKIDLKNYKYPWKKYEGIFPVFKNYAFRISRLNKEYKAHSFNYIVIDGDLPKKIIKLSASYCSNNKTVNLESEFNLVGIRKLKNILEHYTSNLLSFESIAEASEVAKISFCNELVFLPDVNKKKIEHKLSPSAGPPLRIYYYLQTLSEIVKNITSGKLPNPVRIVADKLDVPRNKVRTSDKDKKEYFKVISEIINAWGCICSGESLNYIDALCVHRSFSVPDEGEKVFSLHLKPSTSNRDGDTARIYFDYYKGKFRIAFIGYHPCFCKSKGKKCTYKRLQQLPVKTE